MEKFKKFNRVGKKALATLAIAGALGSVFNGGVLAEKAPVAAQYKLEVKEDKVEDFVDWASENQNNMQIKDFHDYCLNILALEDAFRKGGALYGLIDEFDNIILEPEESSFLRFNAVKDGNFTCYVFDLSSSGGSIFNKKTGNLDLTTLANKIALGEIKTSDLKLAFKEQVTKVDNYKLFENEAKQKLTANSTVSNYLKNGYELYLQPAVYEPTVTFSVTNASNKLLVNNVNVRCGNVLVGFNENNLKTNSLNAVVYYSYYLVNPSTLDVMGGVTYSSANLNITSQTKDNLLKCLGVQYPLALERLGLTEKKHTQEATITVNTTLADYSSLFNKTFEFSIDKVDCSKFKTLIFNPEKTNNPALFQYLLGRIDESEMEK